MIFFLILFQKFLQVADPHSYSHNPQEVFIWSEYLAVHKYSYRIIRTVYLIVIHIYRVFQIIFKHTEIPVIFRFILRQHSVNSIKIVIPVCLSRYQKNRVKVVFFTIRLQIILNLPGVCFIFQVICLILQMIHQKTVMSHGNGNIDRLCKQSRKLIINPFCRQ